MLGQLGLVLSSLPSVATLPFVSVSQLTFVVSLLAFAGCLHWMVPWQVALAAFSVAAGPARSVPGPVPSPQVSSSPAPTTIHMAHPILM